ncbi:hypothetical protein AVTE2539_12990 [Acidovorax sp. SUPP2539]|nr:hypothetical protein AVTE2539_12990 [Acidovorax sp. SUPP2539]
MMKETVQRGSIQPSPCREFEAGSDACRRARQRHGLAALPDSAIY